MKVSHLKFTYKFILLISCLVILVSTFLVVTTIYLSHDGKKKVQKGVAEKLRVLRKESMEEFGKFAEVAEDGIEQASGVAAIEKIMSIATENQERFLEVVNESIEKAGDEVATAVESENIIFREGLEELLIDSTDSMNEIMEFDTESMRVLTNVATFNMDSLNTSSLENLKRFTSLIENFEKKFEESQELQNEEFDDFLIQLIDMLEASGQENEALIMFLLEAFEEVKETSRKRQEILYQRLHDEFDLQSKLVAEELKLVNRKVRYAINLELSHTTAIQEEKIDAVLNNLLEHQITLQEKIDKTSETLTQAVSELKTNLPLKLKEEGETVRKKIEEQSREAGKNAEDAKVEVSLRIRNSTNDTAATFETGITGTEDIINQTLNTSANRTLTVSLGIAVLCVLLSMLLGSIIIRAMAKPLNRVVSLVKKVSDGDFSETLAASDVALDVNRRDEIGILASAVIEMKRVLSDVLKEIVVMIDSIQEGKLDCRGNVEAFAGDWRDLVVELNGVIDAFVAPINVTAEYLDRLAKGDIPEEITEEYKGDFNEIKNNLNQCINAVSGLVDETVRLTGDAVDGRLDTRGNPDMFQGDFAKIVHGINATLNAVVNPLNVAAEYVERIARGDIPEKIIDKYKGDFNEIRNNLNSLIDGLQELTQAAYAISGGDMSVQVNRRSEDDILAIAFQHMVETIRQVIGEIDELVRSTMEGRLDIRGDYSKFRGDYASIVKGVNDTLDAVIGPLTVAAEYVDRISEGDIPDVITDEYRGDFNDIKHNLNTLINSTNDVITLAQGIAGGNLNVTVELRSEQDDLMIALQKMISYLQEVADVTEKISNEDLQVDVKPKSEHDVLNHSLQKMVTTLQSMIKEIERSMNEVQQQNWIRTGQAELSNSMRGEQELPLLAKNIISYLASYLQAKVGTIYLADEESSSLQLVGSYAYVTRKGNLNKITLGDGLVGQAALEKQPILFTDVPDDYLMISSSLGETVPHSILVAPFMYEGEVKGIVELGTAGNFTEVQRIFLEQVLENIAITFHSAQTRGKMQELLEATQRQAQELQTQQETLRVANEELETQTAALRESERKLQTQQEELRQTNEELEEQTKALERQQRILQDKNLELENARQLVEEKANELEISSKYKSEFLANMSHELRTPLNSLLILSRILSENKEGNLTEKQTEFAKTIHAAGSDLLDLINEVLDLSKIEAGKMILHIEAMSLKGLSNYIAQHFSHIVREKGLKLNIKLAKGLPASIRTDRQRVEQILKNLLSNAIKFTAKGGVTVVIKRPAKDVDLSHSGLNPQHTIVISVSDTGIGIPEEKQRLIFEAFQQADGTTSRRYGGTGLGLSIVREFTKLLGGEIHLHSKEGQGSRFSLYLPETLKEEHQIVPSPEAIRKTNTPPVPAGATTLAEKVLAGNEKQSEIETIWDDRHDTTFPTDKFLLIIEDDPKFAKILFDLSREKGFKGLIAGDGAAGLQLAYQYKPSAIILDVGLPDIDGWSVMKKLKNNPETRHIPVHFISAYDQPLDAMKMGAIGYLTKPVSPAQLNETFTTIEQSISKTIGKLLIVEDDEGTRLSMLELLGGGDVDITIAKTGEEAYTLLKSNIFDCMVLDLGLADISGFELLEKIHSDTTMAQLPIIVYTARDLTKDEEIKLKKHAESIIIKGARSQERLLDEVTLFLHRVEAELPEAQQKKLKMIHDKEAVLEGKTVLMVDDDMRNVFALASVLEEKGIHVLIGENGREALELLNTHPNIDLVLMDIMMPEMDGYETTREIRKQPKFRNLPVIALTAKAMKGDRQKCIDAGANDYLSKPVDADKLLSLLRVWLY